MAAREESSDESKFSILAFSDWRTQPIEDLHSIIRHIQRDIDIILYAGDDVGRFVDTTKNHFHKLAQTADAELGYVLGNDDSPYALRHFQLETNRVYDLHRNPIRKEDTLFVGHEGDVGSPSMGYIQYTEKEAENHLLELTDSEKGKNTVLVSHTPPHGTLDYAQRHSEERVGSKAVKRFAERVQPEFILSGHVHQFGGQTVKRDFGPVINIASHDHNNAEARLAFIDIPVDSGEEISVDHTNLTKLAYQIEGVTGKLSTTAELRKLSQVGPSRAESLQENGIETIDQVVSEGKDTLIRDCHIPESYARKIYNHAKAYQEDGLRITDRSRFQDVRDREPILVDIETNLAQDKVWCIGAYDYVKDKFEQFVELDNEEALIAEFHQFLSERKNRDIVYYAGNAFDKNRLIDAGNRHNYDISGEIGDWIDLCLIARDTIFQPQEGHTLSSIAGGLGYGFEYPSVTGMEVGATYSAYQSDNEVPDSGWKQYLEYNLDDTIAMKFIIDVVSEKLEHSDTESIVDFTDYSITPKWESLPSDSSNTGDGPEKEESTTDGPVDEDLEQFELPNDVSEILNSRPPKSDWTETDPIKTDLKPYPRCADCGEPLPTEDDRKKDKIRSHVSEDDVFVCKLECELLQSIREYVECSKCSVEFQEEKAASMWNPLCPDCDSDQESKRENRKSSPDSDLVQSNPSETTSNEGSTRFVQSETVNCHECGDSFPKSDAVEKYRINDGRTVLYCPSCG